MVHPVGSLLYSHCWSKSDYLASNDDNIHDSSDRDNCRHACDPPGESQHSLGLPVLGTSVKFVNPILSPDNGVPGLLIMPAHQLVIGQRSQISEGSCHHRVFAPPIRCCPIATTNVALSAGSRLAYSRSSDVFPSKDSGVPGNTNGNANLTPGLDRGWLRKTRDGNIHFDHSAGRFGDGFAVLSHQCQEVNSTLFAFPLITILERLTDYPPNSFCVNSSCPISRYSATFPTMSSNVPTFNGLCRGTET